jgi:hypothetical protein
MAEPRSPLKEFRHLDEKLQTVGLSAAEHARWESLRALVSPGAGARDAHRPAAGGFDVEAAAAALRASLVPAGTGGPFAAAPRETGALEPGPWRSAEESEAGWDPGRETPAPLQPEAWAEVQPGEESRPAAEPWAEPVHQPGDPWQAGPVPQEGAVAWDPNAAPPLDANWAEPAVESWPPAVASPEQVPPAEPPAPAGTVGTGHYDAAAWDEGAVPGGAWEPGSQPGAAAWNGDAAAWTPEAGGAAAWDPSAPQDAGTPPEERAGWEDAVAGQDPSLWADAPPHPAEVPAGVGGEYDAQAEPLPGSPDLDPSRWPEDGAGALFQATPAELAAWEAAATDQAAPLDQAAAPAYGPDALDASSLPLVEEVSLEEITLEELEVESEAAEVVGEPLPGAEMLGEVPAAGPGVAPLDPLDLGLPAVEPLAPAEVDAGALAPDDVAASPLVPEPGGFALERAQPLELEPAPLGGPGQEGAAASGDAGPPPELAGAGAPLELSSAADFLSLVSTGPAGGMPFETGATDLADVPEVTAEDIEEVVDELVEVPGETASAALAAPDVAPTEPPFPAPEASDTPQALEPWVATGPAWTEPSGPPAAPADLAAATVLPGTAEVVALEELMVTPPPRGAEALAPPLPPSPALAVEEPVAAPPPVAPPLILPRGAARAAEPWDVRPSPAPFAPTDPTPAAPVPVAAVAAAPAPSAGASVPPPGKVARPAPEPVPTAAPAPDAAPAFVSGEHRVVLHTVEGQVLRGSLADVDLVGAEVPLLQPGGELLHIPASRTKAVFFMLGPGESAPAARGTKVRVTFSDGRQVAGMSPDYAPGAPGFFLVPLDSRTNTGRIWIYRDATRQVSVG